MRQLTLAHLSDLHFGSSREAEAGAVALCRTLLAARIDHVVVTGDVTHRGRRDEYERFTQVFHPLLRSGRMTVVPGNHDRLGDDVRVLITGGLRVSHARTEGLCVVTVDSTAPHNRGWLASHGEITSAEIDDIAFRLTEASPHTLKVVALHHHPLPLPEDTLSERLVSRLGSANGAALALGPRLIETLCGRCDLVLHGHRHVPRELTLCGNEQPRPLRIVNAGSSTELGSIRVFAHAHGRLLADPHWLSTPLDGAHTGRTRSSLGLVEAMRAISLFG